jgi:hypothetical protein
MAITDKFRDLINSAQAQLETAAAAHKRGDDNVVRSAHGALGTTLRAMHGALGSLNEDDQSGKLDSTPLGGGKQLKIGGLQGDGTSSPPRYVSPLYARGTAGIADWLASARAFGKRSK